MSYEKLKIYQLAKEVSIEIHTLTVNHLSKIENVETGSQIRRSSKSVRANIVEGYGRRQYNKEFIRFLIYALASNDETLDHLRVLREIKAIKDCTILDPIENSVIQLGKMLNKYLQSIQSRT
jgi:four helix bundle protein